MAESEINNTQSLSSSDVDGVNPQRETMDLAMGDSFAQNQDEHLLAGEVPDERKGSYTMVQKKSAERPISPLYTNAQ